MFLLLLENFTQPLKIFLHRNPPKIVIENITLFPTKIVLILAELLQIYYLDSLPQPYSRSEGNQRM